MQVLGTLAGKKKGKLFIRPERFLAEIDKPLPDDEMIIWPDNGKFFEILQGVLNKLHHPISIAPS